MFELQLHATLTQIACFNRIKCTKYTNMLYVLISSKWYIRHQRPDDVRVIRMTKLLQCNTTGEIYLLSLLCTNGSDLSKYDCVKSYTPATDIIRTASGIWLTLVGILGIFGNLATLTTIPYAAKRRRYGLHNNYFTTTFYILHLAFMDLLHCLLIVLPLGILYSSNSSPFGQYGCKRWS